jgi:hypothetical protein
VGTSESNDTEAQGGACASQAGAAFSNPFKSELARDCEITSPSRFANGPAWQMGGGGLIVEGVKREMCLQNDTFYVMNCKWKFHLVSA